MVVLKSFASIGLLEASVYKANSAQKIVWLLLADRVPCSVVSITNQTGVDCKSSVVESDLHIAIWEKKWKKEKTKKTSGKGPGRKKILKKIVPKSMWEYEIQIQRENICFLVSWTSQKMDGTVQIFDQI